MNIRTYMHIWLQATAFVALALLLSGCLLRLALSTVTVDNVGDFVDITIELVFENVSGAVCLELEDQLRDCSYAVATEDGDVELTSTFSLLSEFGIFGVLIDPVIVQVPENTGVDRARVDDGDGARDLVVSETPSFEAAPGVAISAEPGHKFLIFEFPADIESNLPEVDPSAGPEFDFDVAFSWRQSEPAPIGGIPLKVMYAGRVTAGGQTYYPLTFPCVTDINDVPAITLPTGGPFNAIFNILFHYFDNTHLVCAGEVYDYTDAGPGPGPLQCDADLDADVDRNDIRAIIEMRNTPASGPDDPLDRDGSGTINVLDARKCVLDCTLPRCVEP